MNTYTVKGRACPVECSKNLKGFCMSGNCDQMFLFRQVTGICETCNSPMSKHPICDACGILVGAGHLEEGLFSYRKQAVCGNCRIWWQILEKTLNHRATFEEYKRDTRVAVKRYEDVAL